MFFKNILREFNIFLHCIIIRPYEIFVYDINNKKGGMIAFLLSNCMWDRLIIFQSKVDWQCKV